MYLKVKLDALKLRRHLCILWENQSGYNNKETVVWSWAGALNALPSNSSPPGGREKKSKWKVR